jgi:hypothetical protein
MKADRSSQRQQGTPDGFQRVENKTIAEIGVAAEVSPRDGSDLLPRRHCHECAIDVQTGE